MPGEIGGDEAAERRSGERPDKRWNCQKRHGRDEFAARRAAHQHQAGDRRHHRSAHALQKAREDEGDKAVGDGAENGTGDEDEDRRAENLLGAEAVRHPAAQGNEDRKRHHIGGQRQLERDRPDADVAGDCRQRRGNYGRIHLLHEKSDGKDHRDDTVHGMCFEDGQR
ncbi:hypothetical protein D9M70_538230 [compost metagenome]